MNNPHDKASSVASSSPIRRHRRRGLSLVEALLSLSISAMLLTAVGAAYRASAQAIEMNDQFFRATQAARVSINQVMAEVRKCQSGVVSSDSLELTTANGHIRTYTFDDTNDKLTITIDDGVTPVTHTMAKNVQGIEFFTDGQTISMTVTVQIGSNQIILNGSALPRRTLVYK